MALRHCVWVKQVLRPEMTPRCATVDPDLRAAQYGQGRIDFNTTLRMPFFVAHPSAYLWRSHPPCCKRTGACPTTDNPSRRNSSAVAPCSHGTIRSPAPRPVKFMGRGPRQAKATTLKGHRDSVALHFWTRPSRGHRCRARTGTGAVPDASVEHFNRISRHRRTTYRCRRSSALLVYIT